MSEHDKPTIEITPAMIEAGARVLCGMQLAFATEEYYAKEVFMAMIMAHHQENLSEDELEVQQE